MTKIGSIELFFTGRHTDTGKLVYKSREGAYELHVPRNEQTDGLTFRIEIEIHTEQSYTA